MAFRFLHTADWHVGKPFHHVPGDAGFALRKQRIDTVGAIAELARAQEVDAVLVAGDAFDDNKVADRTIHRLLEALKPFAGTWVFLPGNHDAATAHSVWTRMRDMGLPKNVVIADTPAPVERWDGRATVLPAPLRRRREDADQTGWFDGAPSPEGACRVGLAHGSVAGRLPDRSEAADIPDGRAASAGLCYLALGDWHGALRIAPRAWYSGTPEPDRHKANESGSVHLVTIDGPGAPERIETVEVGHFCWTRLDVELVDGTADAALSALDGLDAEHLRCVVSLRLRGSVSLAERARLERAKADWEARTHHLEVDDRELVDEPTDDDLDALDRNGFVGLAVGRLKARASDPADPERAAARMALRLMYLDHVGRSV